MAIPVQSIYGARQAGLDAASAPRPINDAAPLRLREAKVMAVTGGETYTVGLLPDSGGEPLVTVEGVRTFPPQALAVGDYVWLLYVPGRMLPVIIGVQETDLVGYWQGWRDLGFAGCLAG